MVEEAHWPWDERLILTLKLVRMKKQAKNPFGESQDFLCYLGKCFFSLSASAQQITASGQVLMLKKNRQSVVVYKRKYV